MASVLVDRPDVIFFASGVSNSRTTDESQYDRECELLLKQDKSVHLVYFSSLCIYYSVNDYAEHKLLMEWLIPQYWNSYTIVRLGNISWGKNPHTLLNYLNSHPDAELLEVYRYIVSLDEFLEWMSMIRVGEKDTMNITGTRVYVPDLRNLKFIK